MRFGHFAAALALGVATAASAQADTTFRWAFQGDVQYVDPHSLNETFTLGTLGNIYEALSWYDRDLNLIPSLAESWENVEPTKWIFHLRQGVTFHNGNPFTADDVIFSWQRTLTEGSDMKGYGRKATAINKIDDHTIEVITPTPNPILPRDWVFMYIMDKEWSEANNTAEATNVKGGNEGNYASLHTNGTGPFKMVDRQIGVRMLLERNQDYWQDIPSNVDQVIFTPIAQDATRVAALISGDVDLVYPVPVQDWGRLEAAAGVKPLAGPEARTIFLGMDQDRDELLYSDIKGANPFQDQRVRLAFAHAIDIEAIRRKIMRTASYPTGLLIGPAINGYNAEVDSRWPLDVDRAQALMAEAGYADGFEVTMDCPNDRYVNDEAICQAVAAMLARIGVTVNLLAQTKSKYFGKVLAQADFDTSFYLLGWTPSSLDAHNPLYNLMSCRSDDTGAGLFNLGGYCNARVDELAALVEKETDPAQRQAYIDEAFQIHWDEVGHIPLHQQPLSWGVRDGIELAQRADNVLDLRNVMIVE